MKNLLVIALVILSATAMAKNHKGGKYTAEQKQAAAAACEASKGNKKEHKKCMKAELSKTTSTEAAKTETTTAPATK
jgi:hypothetical protein